MELFLTNFQIVAAAVARSGAASGTATGLNLFGFEYLLLLNFNR